ncbi:hypothetical protein E2C01_051482 [Portunus trituberculatus]|uniref:Uncharacterized protein n=1 Tax=Portunus trituberculatus TaxID=210409 RepID=A0A5B7GBQ5_PORTR|nr:hypothetical protein [Portunus trituberculatus]
MSLRLLPFILSLPSFCSSPLVSLPPSSFSRGPYRPPPAPPQPPVPSSLSRLSRYVTLHAHVIFTPLTCLTAAWDTSEERRAGVRARQVWRAVFTWERGEGGSPRPQGEFIDQANSDPPPTHPPLCLPPSFRWWVPRGASWSQVVAGAVKMVGKVGGEGEASGVVVVVVLCLVLVFCEGVHVTPRSKCLARRDNTTLSSTCWRWSGGEAGSGEWVIFTSSLKRDHDHEEEEEEEEICPTATATATATASSLPPACESSCHDH